MALPPGQGQVLLLPGPEAAGEMADAADMALRLELFDCRGRMPGAFANQDQVTIGKLAADEPAAGNVVTPRNMAAVIAAPGAKIDDQFS
nr:MULTISPECIES: hypothetical protein [unclassified Cyanobium]